MTDYVTFYQKYVNGLSKAGKQYLGWCPFHADEGSSHKGFSLNPDDGLWFCHSCGTGGGTIHFCRKHGISIQKAPDYDPNYIPEKYGKDVTALRHKERKGVFKTEKDEGAEYELHNPMALDLVKETLFICEGAKDAKPLMHVGEQAVAIPSTTQTPVLDKHSFDGIPEIIVAMDHDDAGDGARHEIAKKLPNAKHVIWPEEKPEGFDVTDLAEESPDDFVSLLKEWAYPYEPYKPLGAFLRDKRTRDLNRDPDKPLGLEMHKFKGTEGHLDGLRPGYYIIGGKPNCGKTALSVNWAIDLLESNPDAVCLFFSLDDPLDRIVNRFLSVMSGLPMNDVVRLKKCQEAVDPAYDKLMGFARSGRLVIRDEIYRFDSLQEELERAKNKGQMAVFVDAMLNIQLDGYDREGRHYHETIADQLKRLANRFRVPLVCTAEVRKGPPGDTAWVPGMDDIKESGRFTYAADAILVIHPRDPKDTDKEQITLDLHFQKNKVSGFKGTQPLTFQRAKGRLEETSGERKPERKPRMISNR